MAGAAAAGLYILLVKSRRLGGHARVLLIGDSLGVGLAHPLGVRAGEEGIPFRSLVVGSTRITDWSGLARADLARDLDAAMLEFQPTLVLISLGTNDEYYFSVEGLPQEEDDLAELLARLSDVDVVWIGPPTLPRTTNGTRAMIRATGVAYFPSETFDIPRTDGIHATTRGYSDWADEVWAWL